jgi:hypothetical protein
LVLALSGKLPSCAAGRRRLSAPDLLLTVQSSYHILFGEQQYFDQNLSGVTPKKGFYGDCAPKNRKTSPNFIAR